MFCVVVTLFVKKLPNGTEKYMWKPSHDNQHIFDYGYISVFNDWDCTCPIVIHTKGLKNVLQLGINTALNIVF